MRSWEFNLFMAFLWAIAAAVLFLEYRSGIAAIPACLASVIFLGIAVFLLRKSRKNKDI